MSDFRVLLPLQTYSVANTREHWLKRMRKTKIHRSAAGLLVRVAMSGPVTLPCTITITRVAPRKLDSDNLARSQKAIRDGIADAIGYDDGNEGITWVYKQERGQVKEYAVLVEVEEKGVK